MNNQQEKGIERILLVVGLLLFALAFASFKFAEHFQSEWYGLIGFPFGLAAMFIGMTLIMISLNVPSPLSFLHRDDKEIIERLDRIENTIGKN